MGSSHSSNKDNDSDDDDADDDVSNDTYGLLIMNIRKDPTIKQRDLNAGDHNALYTAEEIITKIMKQDSTKVTVEDKRIAAVAELIMKQCKIKNTDQIDDKCLQSIIALCRDICMSMILSPYKNVKESLKTEIKSLRDTIRDAKHDEFHILFDKLSQSKDDALLCQPFINRLYIAHDYVINRSVLTELQLLHRNQVNLAAIGLDIKSLKKAVEDDWMELRFTI
jgi:hypothetical protein